MLPRTARGWLLLIPVLLLLQVYAGWLIWRHQRPIPARVPALQEDPLGRSYLWPLRQIPRTGPGFRLRTRWRDGELWYQVGTHPSFVRISDWQQSRTLRCFLLDSDGFQILRWDIRLAQFVNRQDTQGTVVGMEAQGRVPCPRSTYGSARRWEIGWDFELKPGPVNRRIHRFR